MSEASMNVTLLAHTQLTGDFIESIYSHRNLSPYDGQNVALTSIRTCYSHLKPSKIVDTEGEKYFSRDASDGKGGTEADRLTRHIVNSGHTSTMEHLSFTFAIEGVSRSLLAQLTRHRVGFSFSVQSQRYVRLGSGDKSGGFDYVVPETIANSKYTSGDAVGYGTVGGKYQQIYKTPKYVFEEIMNRLQDAYDELRRMGIPPEDARAVLPNAAATNLTMTANLRALLDFYGKRRKGTGAQNEIAQLAEELRKCVVAVEPWIDQFFEEA